MLLKFLSFRLPCLSFIPSRSNTVNFFQRRNEDVLWRTVTNITKYGARKGRGKTRQPYRRLSDYYKIGTLKSSPMRIRYPGLNERIPNSFTEPIYFEEQTEEERDASFKVNKVELAKKPPKATRKLLKEKLSAWERGFSGGQWLGQKLGPPPENLEAGVNFDDFQCICFQVNRVCAMKPGVGRDYAIRSAVFIGNGKGIGGFAFTRAPVFQSNKAVANAIKIASRKLFYIERFEDRTIYQDFFGEFRSTRVFAQRREPGYGVIAHPRIRKICELLGIKDLYVRTEGSTTNYIGIVYAFVTGLIHQESHKQCADRTRLHVVELNPNRMFFPKIVASPFNAPVKLDEEVTPIERMRLEDFYGEGRFPQHYGKYILSYRNHIGHLNAEWKRHPYRNMEKRIIRFLADGEVNRWTRRERKKWSDRQHEMVINGQKPLPLGIGLPEWVPLEGEDDVFLGSLTDLMPPTDFYDDQTNGDEALDLSQKELEKELNVSN